jgi:transposase
MRVVLALLAVEVGSAVFVAAAVLGAETLVRGPRLDQRSVHGKMLVRQQRLDLRMVQKLGHKLGKHLPVSRSRFLVKVVGSLPVVALTYRATVDVPARFQNSKAVRAVFGLTCSKYQSGEIDWSGRISRCGDEMMRAMLYEAAQSMLVRSTRWSWLKAWAMQIARRRGMKKAIVALARRLAVIMHRIWVDGTEFRWTPQWHESRPGTIGGTSSSTERWKDVPRGTMDEMSPSVCLDLPYV